MSRVPVPGNIPAALTEMGIRYRLTEDEAWILCPFHDDRSLGSCSVNTRTGQFYCFSCGKGSGFPALVMEVTRGGWEDSVSWCRVRMTRHISTAAQEADDLEFKSLNKVDTSYQLNEASMALFTDPPAIEMLHRSVVTDACRALGIRWNTEKGAWIFPIRDPETQELWGWQEKSARDTRNRPRDVNKSGAVFGSGAFQKGDRAIVVESPIDCARFISAGIRGAVSGYGVQLSSEQLDWLRRTASGIVWALDNDSAGARATARYVAAIRGMPVFTYNYGTDWLYDDPGAPEGTPKDPGDQSDTELHAGLDGALGKLRWRE